MDKLTKEERRKNMQAVKSSGSKIEIIMAKRLWALGHRYRKNDRTVFGKPDITMKRYKLAIFVDSEFWHGKDWSEKKFDIKSNRQFWFTKIEGNIRRDRVVTRELEKMGWTVIRIWGRDIEKNLTNCINEIEAKIFEIKSRQYN